MQYRSNPDLSFLPARAHDWRGNPYHEGYYRYLEKPFRPEWSKMLRWMITPNPQRAEKKQDKWLPTVAPDYSYLNDRGRDWIVWLGHACFLFQLGGVRLITDPMFSDMPLIKRLVQPPFKLEELTGIDYVLLSHDHRDHVDKESIKRLLSVNQPKKVLAPLGLTKLIQSWVKGAPVEEAGWYQTYATDAAAPRITFLPSRHWCRRGLTDFNQVLWGAFAIQYGGKTYYFGGDSAETTYWAEAGRLFPDIAIAMLGIGAFSPHYMMQDNHANPEEAWGGFEDLRAARLWPMHFGTYDLSDEPISEPPKRIRAAAAAAGREDDLLLPGVNQPIYLD